MYLAVVSGHSTKEQTLAQTHPNLKLLRGRGPKPEPEQHDRSKSVLQWLFWVARFPSAKPANLSTRSVDVSSHRPKTYVLDELETKFLTEIGVIVSVLSSRQPVYTVRYH